MYESSKRFAKLVYFDELCKSHIGFVQLFYTNVQFICCVISVLRWLKTVADCKVETSIRETASGK